MIILSIDSTAKTASVCISRYSEGELYPISKADLNSTLTHSESLLPMIDFCLKNASLEMKDVDIGVIANGPGSFTGVRIGISTLMGLLFARNIETDKQPCAVCVSTLLALALNVLSAKNGEIVCPLMDARRGQYYNALFRKTKNGLKRLCADRVITDTELCSLLSEKYLKKRIVVVGDGAELFLKTADFTGLSIEKCMNSELYQNAFSVAAAAEYGDSFENIINSPEKYSVKKLSPMYLRDSQAERELKNKTKHNKGK